MSCQGTVGRRRHKPYRPQQRPYKRHTVTVVVRLKVSVCSTADLTASNSLPLPPSDFGFGGAVFDYFCNFLKVAIPHPHPHHVVSKERLNFSLMFYFSFVTQLLLSLLLCSNVCNSMNTSEERMSESVHRYSHS